jgi:EmrB/QacA subfamily drug resistance transporter
VTTPASSATPTGATPPGSGNEPLLGALPHRTKMIIVWATLLALFVSAVNQTIVSTALPRIVSDLGGFEKFSWVFTAYMLTSTVSSPVWGKLSDRWGRKIFLVIGVCIFIVTSAASGLAQDMNQLILFRGVQGFGAGMVMSSGFTVIGDLFAPVDRARYQGLLAGVFGVASITGPLVGGYLTDAFSWRWAFYANIPIGLVTLPILFKFLPTARGAKRGSIDVAGVVVLTAAVVPLLLAFVWAGSEYPWGSSQITGLLAISAVMTFVFVVVEHRAEDAIIPLELFRNRTYCVVSAITLLLGLAMFGAIVYVPLFAQGVIGATATSSGLVTAPMMVAMVIASAIAGNIMSQTGKYKALAITGVATMTVGLFLLSTMGASTTQLTASFFMIVVGLGIGTGLPIMSTIVQNAIPVRLLGVVTSNMQFYRSIGGTIGVALMGAMVTGQLSASLPPPHPALTALGPEVVGSLQSPQALISLDARDSLGAIVSQLPAGDAIFASALESLRLALADSLQLAFFVSVGFSILGVLVATLLVEHPLRSSVPAVQSPAKGQASARAQSSPAAVPVGGNGETGGRFETQPVTSESGPPKHS